MKKHLVPAVVAMTAALGLLACSHDKTKEEGMAAPAAPAATTTTSSTDTTSTADVAAAEATPSPAPDTSAQQTKDYEKSSRK